MLGWGISECELWQQRLINDPSRRQPLLFPRYPYTLCLSIMIFDFFLEREKPGRVPLSHTISTFSCVGWEWGAGQAGLQMECRGEVGCSHTSPRQCRLPKQHPTLVTGWRNELLLLQNLRCRPFCPMRPGVGVTADKGSGGFAYS